MQNDTFDTEAHNAGEDKTSINNDTQDNNTPTDNVDTLKYQRQHWKEKAIDQETGKTYKELYEESLKTPKVDTTVTKAEDKKTLDPKNFDYGELAFYNTKTGVNRIESNEDLEFLQQTMQETGKSQNSILESNWFQSELKERQESRASINAIPKSRNRVGEPSYDETEMAYAKFQETGTLPEDLATRIKVKNKLVEAKRNEGMFSGPSVIGPIG